MVSEEEENMMKSDQQKENFWVKLLHEEDGSYFWNQFLRYRYSIVPSLIIDEDAKKFWHDIQEYEGPIKEINKFEESYGKPPKLSKTRPIESFMDFKGMEFPKDISFAGRVLVGADFRNAVFKGKVDFTKTVFLGSTHFEGAKFLDTSPNQPISDASVSFSNSSFESEVNFTEVHFPSETEFGDTNFSGSVHFQGATFGKELGQEYHCVFFDKSNFKSISIFSNTTFNIDVSFENVEFKYLTLFEETCFRKIVSFNNSKFHNMVSFRKASFDRPPKFYNTEIHEDMNFNGIDWNGAEQSYNRNHRQNDKMNSIEEDAENAIRAWDRLALIMSKQEKPAERHEFFRLKLRALRQRDGNSLLTGANWMFDKMADYGWGVKRVFIGWIFLIFGGAITLIVSSLCQATDIDVLLIWMIIRDSLLVSFSNSVAFLGLGSEGGHLNDSFEDLKMATGQLRWVFSAVGSIQAVLGPILLFLVLLTLRNRFRLK